MAVQIVKPKEETNIGRRLLGMAAPIVGGIFGGPAGAAAGSVLGAKLSGQSGAEAALSGLQAGAGQMGAPKSEGPATAAGAELNDSTPYGRRMSALSQDPKVGIQEGLNVVAGLPEQHPLRQQYMAPLVRSQMKYGG